MTGTVAARAAAHYHQLLTPDVAAESWAALEAAMREERLFFGDRPVCTVLRPYFIGAGDAERLGRAAGHVVAALHRVFAALDPAQYESVLGLAPAEAELAAMAPGFDPPETVARLDGFWEPGGGLGFVEYNAESPGGLAFGFTLGRLFASLPVARQFVERYTWHVEPVLDHTLDALVAAYRAWGGSSPSPRIAIVDRLGAPTAREFSLCREAFRARGFAAEVVGPDELEYSAGRLRAGDFEIDVVYRRIIASDVAANLGAGHPLVRAARDRAACVASGFRAFAIHSKAMLALASEAAARGDLPADEGAAVEAHVPWTRVARDARTTGWDGREVDLLEFASAARAELVVKPATDYGGAGVVLGWRADSSEWDRALRAALDRPSVVQRRVPVPAEPFPCVVDGALRHLDLHADIDPYSFNGRTSLGAGTRLSSSELLNVTAGGGSAAPVVVVRPRR
jgi:hypothetical protein